MKRIIITCTLLLAFLGSYAQEVSIDGNKFRVNGSEIWFNGINTPWHLFVDFGRSDFDPSWWEQEFQRYAANNINLARVWIHCSGEVSPTITSDGEVTGVTDAFWDHMDHLIEVSRTNQVYVMPSLFSFDITKNTYSTYEEWRAFLNDPANIQSYIDNVLIPMVQRYDDEPYLLAWEICNEPEWMFENTEHGPQPFEAVQQFHAMLAAAIHENSSKPVTTGSAAPKWNSPIYDDWGDYEGNMFSDSALAASANNPNAYLDFYQYHWYPWQTEYMSSPFQQSTAEYQVDDRPVIVGETEGADVCDDYICQTLVEMYENAYQNGFDGVCAWKTPQNDGHGTFENIAVATNAFYDNHPALVYPNGSDPVSVTGVSLSETSLEIEERDTYQLEAIITPSDATDQRVEWSSSNPSVASVSGNGLIEALAQGNTTITVVTSDGGYTASCAVTVTEITSGGGTGCEESAPISLPFEQNGAGEYCWVTSGTIDNINSWGMDILEINGEDFTNAFSSSMPPRVDGNYYIYYEATSSWAHFEISGSDNGGPDQFTLTTSTNGSGSVSFDPASTNGVYDEGTVVTVTANANTGWQFDNWSGDLSGSTNPTTITMNSDQNITANFSEVETTQYTLTTSTNGSGSISLSPSGGIYDEGTDVTISASAEAGWEFDSWSGDLAGSTNPTTITMNGNQNITANFTEIETTQYTLNTSTTGSGSISLNPAGGIYDEGTVVTITASSDAGWQFDSWSGDLSGSNNPESITMNADHTVSANFTEDISVEICTSPESISVPFSFDGEGEYCWVTSADIAYINSWNLELLEINGVDYTNSWSNSLPAKIDGNYYIHYISNYSWGHFEAPETKKGGVDRVQDQHISIYPNPFEQVLTLQMGQPENVDRMVITDPAGRVVQTINKKDFATTMEIGGQLDSGIYFLIVNAEEDQQTFIIHKQ